MPFPRKLTLKTRDRIGDSGKAVVDDFARSYLGIRLLIGALGLALPVALALCDWLFLQGDARLRGSMSAYYHSSARDLFVGGLVAIGVILCSYMSWKWDTWDFWSL